jgi:hypothetical protein
LPAEAQLRIFRSSSTGARAVPTPPGFRLAIGGQDAFEFGIGIVQIRSPIGQAGEVMVISISTPWALTSMR